MSVRHWFEKWFVNRRTNRAKAGRHKAAHNRALELLEPRALLTTATWTSGTSTLAVVGDTAADTLVITKDVSTGNVKVTDGGIPVTITNGPVTPGSVGRITVDGQSDPDSTMGGADSIDLINVNTGNGFSSSLNGNVTIRGGYLNDTLSGSEFNDSILAGNGTDVISGGDGNDTIDAGAGGDYTVSGGNGDDSILAGNSDDPLATNALHGGNGNDTLMGGPANDFLNGQSGNDSLVGGGGSDELVGGADNDNLAGGVANDTYTFSRTSASESLGSDTLTENSGEGTDVLNFTFFIDPVELNLGTTSSQTIETSELTISLSSASTFENATGGAGADALTGSDSVDNYLRGLAGADTLSGGTGNDTLEGGADNDSLTGGSGNDTYAFPRATGSVNLGTDTLHESSGAGTGTDTLDFTSFIDPVELNLGTTSSQTIETNELTISLSSASTFENATGGAGADSITGSDSVNNYLIGLGGNDALSGGTGDDTLVGDAGHDALYGNGGNDTYAFPRATASTNLGTDTLTESALVSDVDLVDFSGFLDSVDFNLSTEGLQTVEAGELYISLQDDVAVDLRAFENVTGSSQGDYLIGTSIGNVLTGGAGADNIRGGGGADTISGGADGDFLSGDTGNDSISGDAGNDSLEGGEENDTLTGGAGNDTYVFYGSGALGTDDVIESDDTLGGNDSLDTLDFSGISAAVGLELYLGTLFSGDTISLFQGNLSLNIRRAPGQFGTIGFEGVRGTDLADAIEGNSRSNSIFGGNGDDVVLGGDGNDTIEGGAGADILYGEGGTDTLWGSTSGNPDDPGDQLFQD